MVMAEATRRPRDGDVVVDQETANITYQIRVVPATQVANAMHYDAALSRAAALAGQRHVDVWFTADHTHFIKVFHGRPAT